MLTYEYECAKCGAFEVEQKISDAPLTMCPCQVIDVKTPSVHPVMRQCNAPVKRLISRSTSFVLKGNGWYKDGYK